jgi:hypothetical protein
MTLQWTSGCSEINERITEGQQLTRLHRCSMHPCQLILLVLYCHHTPKFQALLGHELSVISEPANCWQIVEPISYIQPGRDQAG